MKHPKTIREKKTVGRDYWVCGGYMELKAFFQFSRDWQNNSYPFDPLVLSSFPSVENPVNCYGIRFNGTIANQNVLLAAARLAKVDISLRD